MLPDSPAGRVRVGGVIEEDGLVGVRLVGEPDDDTVDSRLAGCLGGPREGPVGEADAPSGLEDRAE
jgi:hypothetical protein